MAALTDKQVSATTPVKKMIAKKHHLINIILVTAGFILSPLSWWNDLLVNIPLAYLFSLPFSILDESLFLPGLESSDIRVTKKA